MSEYTNKVITVNGTSFRTDKTLAELVAIAKDKGIDVNTFKDYKAARFNEAETGFAKADLGEDVSGTIEVAGGVLRAYTSKGQGFIDSDHAMSYGPSSPTGNSPEDAALYVEKALADKIMGDAVLLGRPTKRQKLTDFVANGGTLEGDEKIAFSITRDGDMNRLTLCSMGDNEKTSTSGVYLGYRCGKDLYTKAWFVADGATGETASFIQARDGATTISSDTVWLEDAHATELYEDYLPLSELDDDDIKAMLESIGVGEDFTLYFGSRDGEKTAASVSFDSDAPRNRYATPLDFTGGRSERSLAALVLNLRGSAMAKAVRASVWIDAETVKNHLPEFYHGNSVSGIEVGSIIATPDARILRVVEVTEKFIIGQHPAGHGETVALPITEGVEYMVVDPAVVGAILGK